MYVSMCLYIYVYIYKAICMYEANQLLDLFLYYFVLTTFLFLLLFIIIFLIFFNVNNQTSTRVYTFVQEYVFVVALAHLAEWLSIAFCSLYKLIFFSLIILLLIGMFVCFSYLHIYLMKCTPLIYLLTGRTCT